MKIALLGYGKMGKEIEQVALARGHDVTLIIDHDNLAELTPENLKKADAAIEFSTPESAVNNIRACFKAGIPVVTGTTGWLDKLEEIKGECKKENQAMVQATNFSVGVNIFFALNRHLAKMMGRYPDYDVEMEEIHHTQKKDAPSGTAITLAEDILKTVPGKSKWVNAPSLSKKELYIKSMREGNIPGTHAVKYLSEIDDIEIKHTAHNRKGFALGAVIAAEWIQEKKGIFTMQEVLSIS